MYRRPVESHRMTTDHDTINSFKDTREMLRDAATAAAAAAAADAVSRLFPCLH